MIEIYFDNESYDIDVEGITKKLEEIAVQLKLEGDISIKLGEKEESQALNKQYREKDSPTDVLSFPSNEETPEGFYIGDIFICYPVAQEQAEEGEISLQQELYTLMVHGIIHLAGLDHEKDEGQMMKLQEELLEKYKI